MTLDQAKIGNIYKIKKLNCTGNIRRRLLDLGIVPSTQIIPIFTNPFKSPTAYQVRGTTIALRTEDAKDIEVVVI